MGRPSTIRMTDSRNQRHSSDDRRDSSEHEDVVRDWSKMFSIPLEDVRRYFAEQEGQRG